jgi:hypothetical protein
MVKGFLALYSEDKDPETKQLVYDTYKWIETTQAAEGMVDVSDAPVLARKALQIVSETDPSDQEMYRKIAQDVVETTINITKSISVDGDTKVTSQSYRSLRALEENT